VPAVTPEVKDALVKNIRRRMTPQPLKIRADVEMKCFQFDGVLHIKVLFATLLPSMQVCFPVYELLILFIGSHEES
jgi:translation initiation factor 2 alpha subunit (eIF-2alpha)